MTDWEKLSGYEEEIDDDDEPRFLTSDEIDDVLNNYINNKDSQWYFPLAPSASEEAAEINRGEIVTFVIDMLKVVKICPSAITELLALVIEQHYKSLVIPGTPIAITAGEAVGASTTQATLNSVAPWEKLLIQEQNGEGHIVEIGKWIDELLKKADPTKIVYVPENRTEYLALDKPVKIVTTDMNGHVTWEDVTAITRHLPVGDLVYVKTCSGREVTATQQKSFLVWNEEKEILIDTNGSDIKVGDYVPIATKIPDPDFVYNELDLKEYLSPKEWIYTSEMDRIWTAYNNYNVPGKKNFWKQEDFLANVPYNRANSLLRALRDYDEGKLQLGYIYPKSWGGATHTRNPEKIVLDRKFGTIIGLYLAEGCATDTFVCISNNAPEIRQIVYDWCKTVGVTHHTVEKITTEGLHKGTSTDVKIHSVLYARLFKQWLNTGSANKIIPQEILFGNREFIIGVLDGYFAGDGTVDKKDGCLTISSASEKLIDGFSFLCRRLGIFGKKSGHQVKSNNKGSKDIKYTHTYSIRNLNADLWYELIGSCHNDKQVRMDLEYKRNAKWGKNYIKHNNIMLDKVEIAEFTKPIEFVYDLTVPTTLNFGLYNGLNLRDTFHSSGSSKTASFGIDAMRDLIFARKVPKNENSTIYYNKQSITYEEVLNSRQYIVGSVIADFIKDYDIDSPNNIKGRLRWWSNADGFFNNKRPDSNQILRLFLNTTEMYKHRVTIKQLADILERESPPSVVARYGPISDGIIDLYPSEEIKRTLNKKIYKKDTDINLFDELAESTYLETIVLPELQNIRVKGIKGIRGLYPQIIPVWSTVLSERKVNKYDPRSTNPKNDWVLFFNPNVMYLHGLQPGNVSKLCQLAGIQIIGGIQNNDTIDRLYVSMPNDRFRTSTNEMVLDVNDIKYRQINVNGLKQFDGKLYESVDKDKIKEEANHYVIQIEDGGIKHGWVEEEIPPVKINVPRVEIRLFDNDYYRELKNLYDEELKSLTDLTILDEKIYKREDGIEVKTLYQDLTDYPIKVREMKPGEYVINKISEAKRKYKAEVAEKTNQILRLKKKAPVKIDRPEIMKASELVIADTEGSNYKELLALHSVDKKRTTCNNMHTISEVLGIEAARTFIIKQLYATISNSGSYVHPANIMFIAEFITSRGTPYGTTFTGISRQPGGHLSLATVERAGQTFTKHALHGRKEDIRNVSASISVGARMHIGNGMFDIAQNITENGKQVTLVNDDVFTAHKRDDAAKERKRVAQPIDFGDSLAQLAALNETREASELFPEIENNQRIDLVENNIDEDIEGIVISKTVKREDRPLPIESEGLVILTDLTASNTNIGFPRELDALIGEYKFNYPEYYSRARLPTMDIPILNSIGINFRADQESLQKELISELEVLTS